MEIRKKRLTALLAVFASVLVIAMAATSCGKDDDTLDPQEIVDQESATTVEPEVEIYPELQIENTTESGKWITVETTYGSFRYPVAFSDIVVINAVNLEEAAQLEFAVQIEEEAHTVYTIYYNVENGTTLGKLKLENYSEEIGVSVVFENTVDNIPADWQTTYYAVQETVNDVINSMSENSGFTVIE